MNILGRKKGSRASKAQQPSEPPGFIPFDFTNPEAFSDANLAKMSGVDTLAFDENDPELAAELRALGFDDVGSTMEPPKPVGGHRGHVGPTVTGKGGLARGSHAPSGPEASLGTDDVLKSLGLGTTEPGEPEFSDADMEDPALLKELGEVSGELEFGDDGDGDGDGDDDGGDDGGKELSEAQGEETPGRKEADPFAGTLKVVAGGRTSVDEDVPVKPEKVPDAMEGIDDDDCSDLDELMAMEDKAPFLTPAARPPPPPYAKIIPAKGTQERPKQASPRDSEGIPAKGPREEPHAAVPSEAPASKEKVLEDKSKRLRAQAFTLKQAGDLEAAKKALGEAKVAENELSVMRKLDTMQRVATVRHEYVRTTETGEKESKEGKDEPDEEELGVSSMSQARRGTGRERESIIKKIDLLKQRASALHKEGRIQEAKACMMRLQSLEAEIGLRPSLRKKASIRANRVSTESVATSALGARPSTRSKTGGEAPRQPSSRTRAPAKAPVAAAPQVTPATQAQFNDLESALSQAIRLHKSRAKELVQKDRPAAAKELRRSKDFEAKLLLLGEMRGVPGALPPVWCWKVTKTNRIRVLEQVPMDEVHFEIARLHGMSEKTENKGSVYIKYDLGYSKDEKIGKGVTQHYRADEDTVNVDFKTISPIRRARSTQMAFQNRRATLEIIHKPGMFSSSKQVGKCVIPLQPLLTKCELTVSVPILTDGRREAGGTVEISLRLRKPIAADEVVVFETKDLEVGDWPDPVVQTGPSSPTPASTPAPATAPAPAAPAAPAAATAPAAAAGSAAAASAAAPAPGAQQVPKRSPKIELTDIEKNDPHAADNIDSNNALETEIAVASEKAKSGELSAVMRKGALETKLLMLVSAVQSGELDMRGYCSILKERIARDKVLALYLKGDGRVKDAVAVMKRIRVMEEELAGVPPEERDAETQGEAEDLAQES